MTLHLCSLSPTTCLFDFFCIFCDLRSPLEKKPKILLYLCYACPSVSYPQQRMERRIYFSNINAGSGTWWYPWFDHGMVVTAHKWPNYNSCTSAVICPHTGRHSGTRVVWCTVIYALFRTKRAEMFEICIYLVFLLPFPDWQLFRKVFPWAMFVFSR